MSQLNNTPTDTLNLTYWERKDGYFKDGIFHCPRYAIFRNGERVTIGGQDQDRLPIQPSQPYFNALTGTIRHPRAIYPWADSMATDDS